MGVFEAIILGIVQGATEFLPVSSTGHLILMRSFLEVSDSHALAFDAVLHLATAAAVIVYFRRDIISLLQTLLRMMGRLTVDAKNQTLLTALIVGTIPAVVLGLLLESYMESVFRNPILVAVVLVLGSVFFMVAEFLYKGGRQKKTIETHTGFKIGLFQSLALIPGMSRSGATIAGGMMLGLSRVEAARFAFLLAVPVILGAGAKKMLELATADTAIAWMPIAIGAATAFLVGLAAIHFMLAFVRNHTLWPFIWYRIILAGIVVFFVLVA